MLIPDMNPCHPICLAPPAACACERTCECYERFAQGGGQWPVPGYAFTTCRCGPFGLRCTGL